MDPQPVHVPVLLQEVLDGLMPSPGAVCLDGTLGAGGHTRALAERVGATGRVYAMDRDPAAVELARTTLAGLPVHLFCANYADAPEILAAEGVEAVDAIVLDLGLSSDQLADRERGFSFAADGPLDLRFDPTRGEPAARLINRLNAEHLADLIYQFGEERHSRRIARAIVAARHERPIETAAALARIIRAAVPFARDQRIDPATRTFQALRIAVNEELKWLEVALRRLPKLLRPGGRIAVISFHSLEDRRVKEAFRAGAELEVIARKPITPGDEELLANSRSRSAKLRIAQRRAAAE